MTDITTRAKAALDGVTEGPWVVDHKDGDTRLMMNGSCQMCDMTYYPWVPTELADWRFIAASRTLVPDLAAEVERLEAKLAKAVGSLTAAADWAEQYKWAAPWVDYARFTLAELKGGKDE